MRVFHIVYSDPIGPSWIAYTKHPEIIQNSEALQIESWVEEVELSELIKDFEEYVKRDRELAENSNDNYLLEIRAA